MDTTKLSYDAASATLTYQAEVAGQALLPKGTGKALSVIARAGTYEDRPVKRVVVRFADDVAAKHNADAMKFLQLETAGPGGNVESDAKFAVREDFGIKASS